MSTFIVIQIKHSFIAAMPTFAILGSDPIELRRAIFRSETTQNGSKHLFRKKKKKSYAHMSGLSHSSDFYLHNYLNECRYVSPNGTTLPFQYLQPFVDEIK